MRAKQNAFHLLDLVSQATAVQALLRGRSVEEKVAWLAEQGSIVPKPKVHPDESQTYWFTSRIELSCAFFLTGDEFVFIGDHTTFTVRD